ncbi:NUDIX domain-containing protein [Nakamurella leprariae]|uniref:NUDIX hydrolase n=1 Tax=Nakamurella leprariae TaxID=2803911 RepID=A0A938YJU8_9ACTN|nr:NUDIX hydrolase [Nakamurella leprariae]MBM9469612.1 NUDIX hydrolase [Nakamurella leprariae]
MSEPGRAGYRVTASRRVFGGRVCAVRIDDVELPGGHTGQREVVEHDPAVAVLALDGPVPGESGLDPAGLVAASSVVLIEQYRHPMRRRLWELPAGLMDVDGESPLVTARRELTEETGLAAGSWSVLVDGASSPGFTSEVVRIFLARDLHEAGRPEATGDEEAEITVVRIPLAEAVAAALDGRIVNVMAVAGILAAHAALLSGARLRPATDEPIDLIHAGDPVEEPGVPDAPALTGAVVWTVAPAGTG